MRRSRATRESTSPRQPTYDDMDDYLYRVDDQTVTVSWADTGRVKTRTTTYHIVEKATGEDVGQPYQNSTAARLTALNLHRQGVAE